MYVRADERNYLNSKCCEKGCWRGKKDEEKSNDNDRKTQEKEENNIFDRC